MDPLRSYHSATYARPRAQADDIGWDFHFDFDSDTSEQSLRDDSQHWSSRAGGDSLSTKAERRPVHELRAIGFTLLNKERAASPEEDDAASSTQQSQSQPQQPSPPASTQQGAHHRPVTPPNVAAPSNDLTGFLPTPLSRKSAASRTNLRAKDNRIDELLDDDAQGRFEARWLTVQSQQDRDEIIAKVIEQDNVKQLWDAVVAATRPSVGGDDNDEAQQSPDDEGEQDPADEPRGSPTSSRPSKRKRGRNNCGNKSGRQKAGGKKAGGKKADGKEADGKEAGGKEAGGKKEGGKKKKSERILEEALVDLCNHLRLALRLRSGLFANRSDDGWGICCSHGHKPIANPDPADKEQNKPDIPFFAHNLAGSLTKPTWADVTSTIAVKPKDAQDLTPDATNRFFRHARKLVQYHPICLRSHQVTVCGTRIRLWQYTPTAYSTSRAYSFANQDDRLDIARILALLIMANAKTLLPQWIPPTTFRVLIPGKAADEEEDVHAYETWEWLDGFPLAVAVRPEIWGSRTTIFGGRARLIDSPELHASSRRLARLDLAGSGDDVLTMIKCAFLAPHLLGHEGEMQEVITDLHEGTPKPIGLHQIDSEPAPPPAVRPGPAVQLQALVYQHLLGQAIPYNMPQAEMCDIFMQLTKQLLAYSAKEKAHYRDLNVGNVLYRRGKGGVAQLVLVDHGNMRLDGRRRGHGKRRRDNEDAVPGAADATDAVGWPSLFAIASEDARSANPLFLPSSMHFVGEALDTLRSIETGAQVDSDLWVCQPEVASEQEDARYEIVQYAHSHLDDLESACYVYMWLGFCRSLPRLTASQREIFFENLSDLSKRQKMWEKASSWTENLTTYCYAMGRLWIVMMIQLRMAIVGAQKDRRKRIKSVDINAVKPEDLFCFHEDDKKCFDECHAILKKYKKNPAIAGAAMETDTVDPQSELLISQLQTVSVMRRSKAAIRASMLEPESEDEDASGSDGEDEDDQGEDNDDGGEDEDDQGEESDDQEDDDGGNAVDLYEEGKTAKTAKRQRHQ